MVCRDRKNLLFFLIITFLPLIFAIVIYTAIKVQLGGFLLTIYESKAINNLSLHHTNTKQKTLTYLSSSAYSLEALQRSLTDTDVQGDLRFFLDTNKQFLTVGKINAHGVFTHVVSRLPEVLALKGQDMSDRDYVQGAIRTRKTYIGEPIVGSKSSIAQVGICAPLLKQNAVYELTCGFISLTELTKSLQVTTPFYSVSSILIDDRGILLIGDDLRQNELQNMTLELPLLRRLMKDSKDIILDEGYNWKGKKVFGMGERFTAVGRSMYLISFLDKDGYISEEKELVAMLNRITLYLVCVWVFMCLILLIFISHILLGHNHVHTYE